MQAVRVQRCERCDHWQRVSKHTETKILEPLKSPFTSSSVLRQNTCIDSEQHATVRSVLADADTRLASLTYEIFATEARLQSLIEEKRALESFRADHARIIHPIHRVPPEIIGEIFMECLPHDDDYREFPCDSNAIPMVLAAVMSRWRNIALALPSLWSTMSIFLSNAGEQERKTLAKMVSLWLERSAQYPLSVYVFWGEELDDSSGEWDAFSDEDTSDTDSDEEEEEEEESAEESAEEAAEEIRADFLHMEEQASGDRPMNELESSASVGPTILESLVKECHRWKSVEFPEIFYKDSPALWEQIRGRLHLLEHLDIGDSQRYALHPLSNLMKASLDRTDLFVDAPKLTSVVLHDFTQEIPLPVAQITDLTLDLTFSHDMDKIFHRFPNLEDLDVSTLEFDDDTTNIDFLPPSLLPVHNTLWRLEMDNIIQFFHTLSRVTLPALQELALGANPDDEDPRSISDWWQHPVKTFLTRSQCPLLNISLKNAPILAVNLIELLHLLPLLEDLTIDMAGHSNWVSGNSGRGINDAVIEVLTHTTYNASAICRNLETIQFRGKFKLDSMRLFEMFYSRRRIKSRLVEKPLRFRRLKYVHIPKPSNFVEGKRWAKLRRGGLEIVWDDTDE